jgi:LPS transport system D/LptA/(LptD N-terminal domain) LPS transport protein
MTNRARRLVLTALFLAVAASSAAQERPPKFKFMPGPKAGGGEVRWQGERIDMERDEYVVLQGEALIEYQDIKLRADKVTYNQKTKDVTAEGHVVIDQGPTRMTANQAVYNLDAKVGTFFNATATMDPAMYFSGDRIEKVDEDTYHMVNGIFTSCDLDNPAWSFHVSEADVTMDDYAHMKNITFRTKGTPVFWAPRLTWPTKRDRSAGFLIPRLVASDEFGTRMEIGYYKPFGDSADATVYADLNEKRYFGGGLDVRYLPSQDVKIGELNAHAVRDVEAKRIEWKYQFRHAQDNLPGNFRGVVDVQDYSRLDFFRQYDSDPRLLTLSNIYSSAYLTRNRPSYSLNILADRRDLVFFDARNRFEQLPSLQLRMYPQRVMNTPLYFQLESSTSHLRTSGIDATGVISEGAEYYRTDVFPTLSLQMRTPRWLSVKPQLSIRSTYYSATLDETTGLPTDDEPLTRTYAQGQAEVVGPSFSKIVNRPIGNFTRFKHVIEPRFRYVYTTNVEDQQRVIRFDTVDTPFLPIVQNQVEYSLTQRIIGKEKGEGGNAREIASFGIRQTVALSEPFENTLGVTGDHKFTPLLATLRFNPYQSITVDANATYGNISHQLDQVSLSANLVGTGKRADKYLGLTWFETLSSGPGLPGNSNVRINAGSNLIRDRFRADISLNFDPRSREFIEQRYLAGWTGSCYGIALEYRNYEFTIPGERDRNASFGIAVTLKNIGTVATH